MGVYIYQSGTETELKNAYIGEYVEPLCFTANTAGSQVKIRESGTPTAVTLEMSTDGTNWSTYTFDTYITLSNVGDKVYFRNTSDTTTGFSIDQSNKYVISLSGSVAASGDITTLVNKNSTKTLVGDYCFTGLFMYQTAITAAPDLPATTVPNYGYYYMFDSCENLITPPKIGATTLGDYCCKFMFQNCPNLTGLPKLPATTLTTQCYNNMFYLCSKIKLSTTQTGDYQTPYRIPTTGTGVEGTNSLVNMFYDTGGTFTGTPSINTTYYTSNTVV